MGTLAAPHAGALKAACAFCFTADSVSSVTKKCVNCGPSSQRVRHVAAAAHVLRPDLQNSTLGSDSFRGDGHHDKVSRLRAAYELPASGVLDSRTFERFPGSPHNVAAIPEINTTLDHHNSPADKGGNNMV